VELTYLGHACFKVTSWDGSTLLIDPYTPGGNVRHRPIADQVDAVVISHIHPGHSGVRFLPGRPQVFQQSGWLGTIEMTAIPTFHDTKQGRKWGPNLAWRITVDEVSLLHLGDMGHMPSNEQLVDMVPCDVLMCPVGGMHSLDHEQANTIIGIINPLAVIPMHYWTPLIGRRIGRLEKFLAGRPNVVPFEGSSLTITPDSLPGDQPTWVLRPIY
jgi:L-ascorbate metabolism protein UlaG (beta-lactamase superfamily)